MLRVDRLRDADEVAPLACSIIESRPSFTFIPFDSNDDRRDCVVDFVAALEGDPFFPNDDRSLPVEADGREPPFPNRDFSADLGLEDESLFKSLYKTGTGVDMDGGIESSYM